nr:hypothetical protein [candidate division Zixibacteria bacterium]NIR62633.1 hypothetical protein [candidate division Zixibacteria bacterium]NIS14801.1 hypothetical protein [candidate division Zixibacteria bacterium]NIS46939.1 hypothetical protein [candidate division Zixibacteria bacterium]NIT51346.1 hypothetical protein [candidate division Zixibacteria bacterium]
AYNPDFSQIEADAAQIDVNTTFALFYPERRPFFQEGSDLFRTLYNSFYTRTINDPKFAAKMIGRLGRTNISALSAVDENSPYIIPLRESSILMNTGRSYVNVFRGLQTIGDNSRIGFLASDRRFEHDGSGTVMALDFDIRLSQNYRIDGQYIGTHTHEPNDSSLTSRLGDLKFDSGKYTAAFDGESYYGTAFITRLLRRSRSFNVMLDYNQISPTYRTQLGYDPINSHRTFSAGAEYVFYPKGSIFERITPSAFQFRRWEFEGGEQRNRSLNMSLNMQTRFAQTYFSLNYNRDWERYSGIEFDRLWSVGFDIGSRLSDRLGYNLSFRRGVGVSYYDLAKGRETGAFFALNLKPYDRLIIEPYINYSRSVHEETDDVLFDGYIFRTRLRYQANREMSLRLIVQYNNFRERWDIDPLLTYRLGSFTVFYVGSTYNYDNIEYDPGKVSQWKLSSRQFFMKLQYLFRS